jgi:peptide/nickel transport system permease protein
MARFLLRRLAGALATLGAGAVVVFLLLEVLPGDPAAVMLGLSATPEALDAVRRDYGLDRPPLVRFFAWIGSLATGQLGQSYTYRVPVAGLVAERAVVTLPLAALALSLAVAIGVPLGVAAAARAGRPADLGVMAFAQAGLAVPNFWLGLLLVLVFSVTLGWLPAGGFPGWDRGAGAALAALVLPAVALALPQAAILARVTRSAVLEVLGEGFVRTARMKGLSQSRVLFGHALPNALVPLVTVLGLQVSFLVAGAIVIENVFSLPGLGRLMFQAVAQHDIIVVRDLVMVFVALVVLVNFVVDVLYVVIDPRLDLEGARR